MTVAGSSSNLPGAAYVGSTGLAVSAAVANLAYDVKTFSVSGAVTLNGANPVSSDTSCYASGTATNFPRGSVVLTDAAQGISFRADLQGCTNTAATFSTNVFPGTYKVTVAGSSSNLPGAAYVGSTGLAVSAAVANLAYDVKTFSVSGAVTLNGANPVSSDTSCYASGTATNFPRGSVVLTDAAQGISFRADLQGCTNTAATFSTNVFPGTYKVTVAGSSSNLPGAAYVGSTGLAVSAAVANLAYDVKTFSVSGAVTLNGANPVSSDTSCYASGTATNFPRGSVVLTDAAQGISFRADLQGCTNTAATFSTNVFPGTYKVTVAGSSSNLPGAAYVGSTGLAVSAAVANLAYDVKTFSVSGAVTLNGANPVSSDTSCYASGTATNFPRGSVVLTDAAQGISFRADLQGCTNTAATFSTNVFPGTYKVTVAGSSSNLPGAAYVWSTGLAVSAAVANLAYDVKTFSVSGAVTLNGANPVSSDTKSATRPGRRRTFRAARSS